MNAIVKKGQLSRLAALRARTTPAEGIDEDPPKQVTFPAQTLPGGDLRIPVANLKPGMDLDYLVPKPLIEYADDAFQPQIRKKGSIAWLYILPGGEDDFIEPGPVAERDWSIPFTIPERFLIEERTPETPTEWEFSYIYWSNGTNDARSDIATFAIDRTRPYVVKEPPSDRTPGAPEWPADLPPDKNLDDEYLEGKTHIIVKPPLPANYEATDWYTFYFALAPDPEFDPEVFEGHLSTAGEAAIPVRFFLEADDGPNQLIYFARDLPRNVSKRSGSSQRNVVHAKDPDPATVLPPVVTLAKGEDGDNLIDLEDTQYDPLGVEFKVKVPTPNTPSDTIIGLWGGKQVGSEQRVGTSTELTFHAPYDIVKAVYGDTDGIVPTIVSFKMFRNGSRELATSSKIIEVDISYIGPDPITIGLEAPRLTTTKGSANEIKEDDYGDTNVTAYIRLFDKPPTQEGWFMDVFYNDIRIGDPIALTAGQEDTEIARNIPWEIIEQQKSGNKVLEYVLYTQTGTNPTRSRPRNIAVEEFPVEMAAPIVQNLAGPRRRIGCATLNYPTATNPGDGTERRNLRVTILPNPYTVAGEEITLKYAAYDKASPPVLIPDTEVDVKFEIEGNFPEEGVVLELGVWKDQFKPAHGGDARLLYVISRGGPGNNPTKDSLIATHELDLVYSDGQYCDEYVPEP
ncbi:hypothetical protein [Pseudomonas sp. GM30]|uniref:hypothetical protein n=1 Tax=Pseudomonas sp. GM30 TaxID=1144328 RepID=UPI0002700361|nr:hypothetical protein [Pseudomonas sp. GM30]EUB84583.1 hypothetical protein PMI25_000960 [Pseudomonas sp. GM30]